MSATPVTDPGAITATALVAAALVAVAVTALGASVLRRTSTRTPGGRDRPTGPPARVPDLVDLAERIARETRAGRGVRDSVADALGSHPALAPEVAHALGRHAPLAAALAAHRPRGDERDLLIHALSLGVHHAHVLAEVLDRTTVVIRERRAWRLERSAQSAQARASARALTVLPAAFALWGALSSPSVRQAYTTSTVTLVVAAVGVVRNGAGWWWMRRVVGASR
ncbi:MAG: type II secretion system F family protein [Actinomycetes bacterium]